MVGEDGNPVDVAIVSGGGSGGLTNTELRATPVPVSGTVAVTEPVSVDDNGGSLTVDAASLPLPTGAATETTLASVKTGTDKIPASPATDRSTAAAPFSTRLSDGSAFYKATTPSDTQPVSGTVTINAVPAGNNNIGDVDVVTVPADPFGVNADAAVAAGAAGSIQAKLRRLSTDIDAIKTSVAAATPAGTNNIGDVDVLTLPTIPAGTNNIGDVDVLTVPADPFGANADAAVAAGAAGSQSAKLRRLTTDLDAIKTSVAAATPAGTNNIGDVDVLTLPAIPAGSNNIGDVDVLTLPATPTGTNTIGKVGLTPQTSGGLTVYHLVSAATTNAAVVKASAGQLFGYYIYNSNAAARKLVFHNASTTPTAGASVYFSIMIPPGAAANVEFSNGIAFSTGIAITTVTGLADSDSAAVAANDLILNLFYS